MFIIKIFYLTITISRINCNIYPSLPCNCGVEQISKRIVGGHEVIPNRYPWIAAITDTTLKTVYCGGTLINNRYLLTAAHCFNTLSRDLIRVVLGLQDLEKMRNVTVYYPDKIIIHQKYVSDSVHQRWDLALIKLDRNVTYTDMIAPVCLPPRNFDRDFDNLIVAGWGLIGEAMGPPSKLLEVEVNQRSIDECKRLLTSTRITDNHICAGNNVTDSCGGDSGGPLMTRKSGRIYLVGIVSWGMTCADNMYPGVYSRVSSYGLWIYNNSQEALYCDNRQPLG